MTVARTPEVETVAPRTAPAPVAVAGASITGVVLAVLLIAFGAVGVRDAVVMLEWLHGDPWIPNAFGVIGDVGPAGWMVPAGIVLALAGMSLVVIAFLPRRSIAILVNADTAVYIRPRDAASAATAAAADVAGVLDARSSLTRRKVTVTCRVTGDTAEIRKKIEAAVTRALEPLHRTPRVAVRVRKENRS